MGILSCLICLSHNLLHDFHHWFNEHIWHWVFQCWQKYLESVALCKLSELGWCELSPLVCEYTCWYAILREHHLKDVYYMRHCWVLCQSDQWEISEIVCHLWVFIRQVLEDINTNLLLGSTQYIMWDERLLCWLGFTDWHMLHALMYSLMSPVMPDQYIHYLALSRFFSCLKWPMCKSLRNLCFWDAWITSLWALRINPSSTTSSSP